MTQPQDQSARLRFATELDRNFSVVASAGSGKTRAVIDRIVHLAQSPAALETLRWAMANGVDPVLVSSSLAANLRTIAAVASAGRGSPDSLAGVLGMPAWKIRKAQGWVRGWRPEALIDAVRAVAMADADIKGGADDAAFAAERAVITVSECASR